MSRRRPPTRRRTPARRCDLPYRSPPWSPFPADEAFAAFLEVVVAVVTTTLGPRVHLDVQAGILDVTSASGPVQVNLRTPALACVSHPRHEWPSVCHELVAVAAAIDPDAVRGWAGNRAEALPRLRLRLRPDVRSASLGGEVAAFECAGGLGASLVYQLDGALAGVPLVDRLSWDLSDDELFALAAAQTVAAAGRCASVELWTGGGVFSVVTGTTALTATLALGPQRLAMGGDAVLLGLASATSFVAVPLDPCGLPQRLGEALRHAVPEAAAIHARSPTALVGHWLLHDAAGGYRPVPAGALTSQEDFDAWRG